MVPAVSEREVSAWVQVQALVQIVLVLLLKPFYYLSEPNKHNSHTHQVYVKFYSRLPVWRYFNKAVNNLTAQCKLCKAVLKTTSGSTKGLHVHIKAIHKIKTKSLNAGVGRRSTTPEPDGSDTVLLPSTLSASASVSVVVLIYTRRSRKLPNTTEEKENQ